MLKQSVLAVSSLCAMVAFGDIFSDAHFWLRNMGSDLNSDGYFDQGELLDSSGHGAVTATLKTKDRTQLAWRTEEVFLPSRYVSRNMRTLWFAQRISESQTYCPTSIQLTTPTAADVGEHYTIFLRIKPDATQPSQGQTWIANYGCSWGTKGLMIGLSSGSGNNKLLIAYPAASAYATLPAAVFSTAGWNDIIVSVDGKKITWLFQAPPSSSYLTSSAMVSGVLDADPSKTTAPSGQILRLGGEYSTTDELPYSKTDTYAKCYRGGVQELAYWTKSLSLDEMRAAISWPRMELMKVGVDNDSTSEFTNVASQSAIDADDLWALPSKFASGDAVTIRFPLLYGRERRLPQALWLKTTTVSASGRVRAVLNGIELGDSDVSAGACGHWLVGTNCLVAATNSLTLTRIDAGASPIGIDSVSIGGSVQIGERTNSAEDDFVHEMIALPTFPLVSGHARAFPYELVTGGAYGSTVIRVDEPHPELREVKRYFEICAAASENPQTLTVAFNGKSLDAVSVATGWHTYVWEINPSDIKEAGNEISLSVTGAGKCWIDSFSWSFRKFRRGLLLIVR